MSTTKKPTATLTIELTTEAKSELEAKARSSRVTVGEIVESLLARQREQDADDAAYEAGVADIEANGGVEHERVVEWLQSLKTNAPLPLPTPNPRLK